MSHESLTEARRQAQICNACRYCESYCSVFPAMHSQRSFSDGDLTQLANLCHNCRGCYYACQYTAPHEFELNLPRALAEVRSDSWESFAWPRGFARLFQRHAMWTVAALVIAFATIFAIMKGLGTSADGQGFYAAVSHTVMVAIFAPAFLLPLASIAIGLRRYWQAVDGQTLRFAHVRTAFGMAANMKDLAAGHGDGCNFEDKDRFSHARRFAHQAVLYGFMLCFLSTSVATVMHYALNMPAPYGFWSLPKIFGNIGGILLGGGSIWMAVLKIRADKNLSDPRNWGAEMAFIMLLGFVAISGLALYGLGQTWAMPVLLALHLGGVLAFFLLMPFSKMAHGFYRMAALVRDAQRTSSRKSD
ncbi:MAG: tricarballylate utilization 4Fe-4S protein TcuB [Planktomarina sp.]